MSLLQRVKVWFVEGPIWRIAVVVAGGLLLISLIILTIYRVRKRRKSKESITDPSMDISIPKDGTFMGSQSADVLLTAEVQECHSSNTKPRLKSKMMKSFKKDDKNDGDNRYSFSSRSQSTASYYGEELTQMNNTRNGSLRNQNASLQREEVIYENQKKVSLKRQANPVYQNTIDHQGQGWNNAQRGKVDEVIYQNASASGAPLCHGYVNSRSTLKQQKGNSDGEYATVSQ